MTRLSILLSILDPLIINDTNLEAALRLSTVEILVRLLHVTDHSPQPIRGAELENKTVEIYLKYAIRCLTSSVRNVSALNQIVVCEGGVKNIVNILRLYRDEEMVANSGKIVRFLLREETHYELLVESFPDLGNLLLETAELFKFSEIVTMELL